MVIHIISYIIAILYICYIFRLWRAWKKAERFSFQTGLSSQKEQVSVVVAFRNEEQHLAKLQNALAKQTYKNYELILVNDHSTDDFKSKISQERRIRLLNAAEEGKKRALLEGVNAAKGDIVLCTDADCLPCPTWIESIVSFFGTNQTDMVIAPVVMIPEKKAFERIQTLEFASLQAATAGSACAGDPIMCNGANMAFKKKEWLELYNGINEREISGDDVFMLHQFKKSGKNIEYLKSQSALVFTRPCATAKGFFSQRARWASKAKSYTDRSSIFASCCVLGICIALLVNAFGAFFSVAHLFTFGVIFISKLLIDRIFLWSYCTFSRETYLTIWIFPASLLYPIYITISAIGGLLGFYQWKK